MKIVEDGNTRYEFESALGESFLTMHEWALTTLTGPDLNAYLTETMTPEKEALFARWMSEQQVTAFRCYVNDELQ